MFAQPSLRVPPGGSDKGRFVTGRTNITDTKKTIVKSKFIGSCPLGH